MTDLFSSIDLKQEYLTSQLIPYLGNKRRLLPFLYEVFSSLVEGLEDPVFIDPFAGSGSVSRLAKAMGMTVHANDWEPYTEVLNGCYIALDKGRLEGLFADRGGIDAVLDDLNGDTGPYTPYISRYYAPVSLEGADYRTERLFYTPENAVCIDRVRGRIDQWYPEDSPEWTILLSSLVLQAAVRSNTSGVFKACHKGFGGHSRDALGRIMTGIKLLRPCLLDGRGPCTVHREDAAVFASKHPADLCYLDPPYNMHQYGSNYHLLNTLVLWDMPEIDNSLGSDGRLEEKAAIRKDWRVTRSSFCSRSTASAAFEELLGRIDARSIVVSYNTEGIIPFEELYDILSSRGEVEVKTRDYTLYRGGRQSISRKVSNLEFQLVCRTGRPASGDNRTLVRDVLLRRRLRMLLKESFVPDRLSGEFNTAGDLVYLAPSLAFPCRRLYRFDGFQDFRRLEELSPEVADELCRRFERAACRDREEECRVLTKLLAEDLTRTERRYLSSRLLGVLRKFAHKKYQDQFNRVLAELEERAAADPEHYGPLAAGLEELKSLANLRLEG